MEQEDYRSWRVVTRVDISGPLSRAAYDRARGKKILGVDILNRGISWAVRWPVVPKLAARPWLSLPELA